jgi:flagellar basal body-associated protein FliL
MIQIPTSKIEEKNIFIESIFVLLLIVVTLASFVVLLYWYIFGNNGQWTLTKKSSTEQHNFVNQNYQLDNLLIKKVMNAR